MKTDIQPKKVERIVCPRCGELQVKIYPWASFSFQKPVPFCQKCVRSLKPGVA